MIYIVIINYNSYDCTEFCLESLRDLVFSDYKILLVDNNSKDDSFDRLLTKFPEVYGISSNVNCGFARGCNIGMRRAIEEGADYVLLLNNDVEVKSDFLNELIAPFVNSEDVGIATPKIMLRSRRNVIWHAGGYINKIKVQGVAYGAYLEDEGQYDTFCHTGWASGACCLISRSTIEKIGLLDEFYFMGQEEWDYSLSAIKNNLKIAYVPSSIVYHEVAGSTTYRPSLNVYQYFRNKLYLARKFNSPLLYCIQVVLIYFYVNYFYAFRRVERKRLSVADKVYVKKSALRAGKRAFKDHFRAIHVNEKLLTSIELELKDMYN